MRVQDARPGSSASTPLSRRTPIRVVRVPSVGDPMIDANGVSGNCCDMPYLSVVVLQPLNQPTDTEQLQLELWRWS